MYDTSALINKFSKVFPDSKPAFISIAPGRVELIGGHTDYNEGFVIASAIDRSCSIVTSPSGDNKISMFSELTAENHTFEISDNIPTDKNCTWANYGRGVTSLLVKKGFRLKGANLYIASDVPLGGGLSSSAALEVAAANALLALAAQLNDIKPMALAAICQQAENQWANSPCGIMDQAVSIHGKPQHAVFIDCRTLNVESIPFHTEDCKIMIFNSMVQHSVGGGEYGERRQSCEKACEILKQKHPQIKALRDANENMLNDAKSDFDPVTFKRASHVVTENARVLAAKNAALKGDMHAFGKLMSASHDSARDLYQISCPHTDFLAHTIVDCQGALGARISGGGFGGSVVALADSKFAENIAHTVTKAYKKEFDLEMRIYSTPAADGAKVIKLEH